ASCARRRKRTIGSRRSCAGSWKACRFRCACGRRVRTNASRRRRRHSGRLIRDSGFRIRGRRPGVQEKTMFITRRALPRRTFLGGLGVAVSLPLLESMVPAMTALAQTPARPSTRFGAVYFPNGAIVEKFFPEQVGSGFAFQPILKSLEPFANQLVIVQNL